MCSPSRTVPWAPYALVLLLVVYSLLSETPSLGIRHSGGCTTLLIGGGGASVGGVSIDAAGVIHNAEVDVLHRLHDVRAGLLEPQAAGLKAPNKLRKVSLRRLEVALDESFRSGKPIDDVAQHLAGLQNIHFVAVFPEEHDILLAGFGEGWKVDPRGNVVGLTTRRPVLLLDDLLVALRSLRQNGGGTISCSIDPTAEGLQRVREFVRGLNAMSEPAATAQMIEQMLGPQLITLAGVPASSHFACVLVAADYRMKRLGMGLDPAPVAGLPSYLQMQHGGARGMHNMTPRWWMVPRYAPLLTDAAGLSFEIRGSSVKTMTEETFFAENGSRRSQTGKTSSLAQQWADHMTAKYEELSAKEPIFAELRNCMDLAVVATLISEHGLRAKAGYDFALLLDDSRLPAAHLPPPRQVDTVASLVKKGDSWVIGASGGVLIESRSLVARSQASETLVPVRASVRATPETKSWWWN